MQMKYIGLDCHKQYDHATMIDTETGEIKAKRLAHIKDEFSEFIGDKSGTRMVIESCRDWSRTYELSEDLVEEIVLAHPLKVKAIASAKIKTDAIDSRTLAQLLMADLIPQAHLRKGDNRIKQRIIRHRAFMVVMRTRVKSRIHALVDSQLLPPDVLQAKPINLFSKKGMKWLSSLKWAKADDKRLVESHLRVMEAINQEISTTNDMVKDLYEKDSDAQLLATIPGIGITLAVLISTEIDGIERFPSPSKLCSYAGLVPSTHSSGGKIYHGRITSEGNKWIRWALVEAAVPASYADAEIKKRIDTFRKTKGANVAKTAVARWLLKIVYHILKERRPYVTAYGRMVEAGAAFYFT
jgi:transposase